MKKKIHGLEYDSSKGATWQQIPEELEQVRFILVAKSKGWSFRRLAAKFDLSVSKIVRIVGNREFYLSVMGGGWLDG